MNVWTARPGALKWLAVSLLVGGVLIVLSNYITYEHMRSSLKCPELPVVIDGPAAQVQDQPEVEQTEEADLPPAPTLPPPPPPPPSKDCIVSLEGCLNLISKMKGIKQPELVSYEEKTLIETYHPGTNMRYKVPNIVHVISFGDQQPFKFFNYVAFKSYYKYIKPHAIFFWGDRLPEESEWWIRTVKEVPNIYYVNIKPKSKLGGEPIQFVAHAADFLRLEIISKIGGLYFDTDTIILKSFDDLRVYELALGRVAKGLVSNGIMAGMKGGKLVQIWMEAYNSYQADNFIANSVMMAGTLVDLFSHLVHIEKRSLTHPTWEHLSDLYAKHYDISENYSLHLYWWKLYYIPDTEAELDGYDCTVGDAMRYILYGSYELRTKKNIQHGYLISRDRSHEMFAKNS